MYLDHRTVDSKANIIVDCHITKGNIHDSKVYIERLNTIKEKFSFNIKEVALDSGYDTIDIKRYLVNNKIFGVIGYRSYGQGNTEIRKYLFKYNKETDSYICPKTKGELKYSGTIDKNGYKKYYNSNLCKNCIYKKECIPNNKKRTILRHIAEIYNEIIRENRLSERGEVLYKMRKETIERSFADSKQNHGYRYAMYKGLNKNQAYTWLICSAQNMKNIAIKNSYKEIY